MENNQALSETFPQAAKRYLGYQLSVLPTNANKQPAIGEWKPYQTTVMTDEDAVRFFGQNNVKGIGIICGKVSGNLEVIDIDCKNDKTGTLWKEFYPLVKFALPVLVTKLVFAKTVNKGYHIYYKCDHIEGNKKIANNDQHEVLIETRGEGGYVNAAPTPGYEYVQGGPWNIPTITSDERAILFSISRTFDQAPVEPLKNQTHEITYDGVSPFDDYNQNADVVGLLVKHDWKVVKQDGERIHLLRPGKTDHLTSGNFHTGKRIFYPFTTSSIFEACRGYNPVQVYTILEAGGDFSKASNQLYEEGFGERRKINQVAQPLKEPAKEPVQPTPMLPIKGFPKELQNIIETCSTVYRTPRDYWAGAVIIATALGIGDKLVLVTNYSNLPVLWLVLVGDVSSGKSNPVGFCLNYFKKLDSESIRKCEEDTIEYNRVLKMTTKERKNEGIAEKAVKPECFQYILNDFTPEAMVAAHKVNNRGIIIERDEMKGWIDDFGRYNKSGEQSNLLSAWSGYGITYNRKTSGAMNIPQPCIMVCGGMQPDLLPSLAADSRAENGFLARLCAVYPDHTEKANYNNAVIPPEIQVRWEAYLSSLVNLKFQTEIRLSFDAKQRYAEWFNLNAQKTNEEKSGYLKGIYGKLDIISLRLAIIIRGMNLACEGDFSEEISGEEMDAAIELTEYFRATALKVYRRIFDNCDSQGIDKKLIANYMFKVIGRNKTDIANDLKTSRSQLDRMLSG